MSHRTNFRSTACRLYVAVGEEMDTKTGERLELPPRINAHLLLLNFPHVLSIMGNLFQSIIGSMR